MVGGLAGTALAMTACGVTVGIGCVLAGAAYGGMMTAAGSFIGAGLAEEEMDWGSLGWSVASGVGGGVLGAFGKKFASWGVSYES